MELLIAGIVIDIVLCVKFVGRNHTYVPDIFGIYTDTLKIYINVYIGVHFWTNT